MVGIAEPLCVSEVELVPCASLEGTLKVPASYWLPSSVSLVSPYLFESCVTIQLRLMLSFLIALAWLDLY